MKLSKTLSISFALTLFLCQLAQAQLEEHELDLAEETATVAFECNNCGEKNRILISGTANFKFKDVKFPFNQEMKLGDYELIYLTNGIPQAPLLFEIIQGSKNVIKVDGLNGPF